MVPILQPLTATYVNHIDAFCSQCFFMVIQSHDTCLIEACRVNSIATIHELLHYGVNVNTTNNVREFLPRFRLPLSYIIVLMIE
jgi:hypothetical protein